MAAESWLHAKFISSCYATTIRLLAVWQPIHTYGLTNSIDRERIAATGCSVLAAMKDEVDGFAVKLANLRVPGTMSSDDSWKHASRH
jgi:hypothetical protein